MPCVDRATRRVAAAVPLLLLLGAACGLTACPRADKGSSQKGAKSRAAKPAKPGTAGKTAPAATKGRLPKNASAIFLHHSTGENVWNGGVSGWLDQYNKDHSVSYRLTELAYPHEPYPWDNYPYDYWNIWVKHAGAKPFQGQETLEMLTETHQVIIFKHCFPVSAIEPSAGGGEVGSSQKTVKNYQAQYTALKTKLRSLSTTRFLVWTGAALTKTAVHNDHSGNADTAKRAAEFFQWVKGTWDEKGDNIFVFDFYALETAGGLYMSDSHAQAPSDPHPSEAFAREVAPRFAQRLVDVIEGRGDTGSLSGG